jgi:hypothetical protein
MNVQEKRNDTLTTLPMPAEFPANRSTLVKHPK